MVPSFSPQAYPVSLANQHSSIACKVIVQHTERVQASTVLCACSMSYPSKVLSNRKTDNLSCPGLPADAEKSNLARRRSSLRLLCELYRVGLHHDCLVILDIVRSGSSACMPFICFRRFVCHFYGQRHACKPNSMFGDGSQRGMQGCQPAQ